MSIGTEVRHVETSRPAWWKGARGEWYVVVQLAFFALILFGPRTWPGGPLVAWPYQRAWSVAALALVVAGGVLLLSGGLWLGPRNLTPLPHPRDEGTLVDTGPFALVRHPIYSGGFLIAVGWAIWVRGPLTLVYVALFLVFLDVKSRREEEWLREKFPGYGDYQARVQKLIPFVY